MTLLVFGFGYTAQAFLRRCGARFDRVVGTVRDLAKGEQSRRSGVTTRLFPDPSDEPALERDIAGTEFILTSVPPGRDGDPVLSRFADAIATAPRLRWIGYLSTIGVYGDHRGDWVDEATPPRPISTRSRERLGAEEAWRELGRTSGKPVQVFRLAGIYGPGRSPFGRIRDGTARRIVKPGQIFNRIHVDDIAAVLEASLDRPRADAVYNVADHEPAPPQDVLAYAARLLGLPPPPEVAFADAELSPMARSFYDESKRARTDLIRNELGVTLRYPSFREGLLATAEAEGLIPDQTVTPRSGSRMGRNT